MEEELWRRYDRDHMKTEQNSLNRSELKTLFHEVGSEDRLRLILRDFYRRMAVDILVGFFFTNKNPESVADQQVSFLMRAMGQSPSYRGKSPAQAHGQLPPILAGHFDRRLKILEETLREHGISEGAIQLWLRFENSFKAGIVG